MPPALTGEEKKRAKNEWLLQGTVPISQADANKSMEELCQHVTPIILRVSSNGIKDLNHARSRTTRRGAKSFESYCRLGGGCCYRAKGVVTRTGEEHVLAVYTMGTHTDHLTDDGGEFQQAPLTPEQVIFLTNNIAYPPLVSHVKLVQEDFGKRVPLEKIDSLSTNVHVSVACAADWTCGQHGEDVDGGAEYDQSSND